MAKNTFFLTGTDTEIGKTQVAVALLTAARQRGLATLGLKPLAAGAEPLADGKLANEDALALQQAMTLALPYEQINPVLLKTPASPHIAAKLEARRVTLSRLEGLCRGAMLQRYDFGIIEGAGGWRVPISDRELLSGLAQRLAQPVILVVGLRLGCLNHALLTAEAIRSDGLQLAGWVANQIDPDMAFKAENIATLKAALNAPCLGEIPYLNASESANMAKFLKIDCLLKR